MTDAIEAIDDEREGEPRFLPTPEQIAEVAAAIQAGWSRETELNRRAWSRTRELDYGRAVAVNLE